jgi:septum formation protein
MTRRLVLASASASRLRLLRHAGFDPEVVVSGVAEDGFDHLTVRELVAQLAVAKASAVAPRVGDALVLGADSLFEMHGQALGKPASAEEAAERWRLMRRASGVLHTGHCLVDTAAGREAVGVVSTLVHFADVRDDEIDAYVATGEPLAVAGAFTVDGLGGPFVTRIEGDHHGVVGVSLPLLRELLGEVGVGLPDLWRAGARA